MRILFTSLVALLFASTDTRAQEVIGFAEAESVIAETVVRSGLQEEYCGNLFYFLTMTCLVSDLDDEAYYALIAPIMSGLLGLPAEAGEYQAPHIGIHWEVTGGYFRAHSSVGWHELEFVPDYRFNNPCELYGVDWFSLDNYFGSLGAGAFLMMRQCGPVPVHATDEFGQTPLIYALAADANEAVNFLIASGSDVNHQTDAGWTPLMYAARAEAWGEWFIGRLIDEGADPAIKAHDGTAALALALQNEWINSDPRRLESVIEMLGVP